VLEDASFICRPRTAQPSERFRFGETRRQVYTRLAQFNSSPQSSSRTPERVLTVRNRFLSTKADGTRLFVNYVRVLRRRPRDKSNNVFIYYRSGRKRYSCARTAVAFRANTHGGESIESVGRVVRGCRKPRGKRRRVCCCLDSPVDRRRYPSRVSHVARGTLFVAGTNDAGRLEFETGDAVSYIRSRPFKQIVRPFTTFRAT